MFPVLWFCLSSWGVVFGCVFVVCFLLLFVVFDCLIGCFDWLLFDSVGCLVVLLCFYYFGFDCLFGWLVVLLVS